MTAQQEGKTREQLEQILNFIKSLAEPIQAATSINVSVSIDPTKVKIIPAPKPTKAAKK